jgi:hypothetical protein
MESFNVYIIPSYRYTVYEFPTAKIAEFKDAAKKAGKKYRVYLRGKRPLVKSSKTGRLYYGEALLETATRARAYIFF